jgi:deazaflavin-dependent oxidoreductase (nitroreductase family)
VLNRDWLIESFRQNDHTVPGSLEARNLFLLTCTGAKSGRKRTVPLDFNRIDGRLVVVASLAGADRNPPWFHNVRAIPTSVSRWKARRSMPPR